MGDLSWSVISVVLTGSLLHAGWNALVKSSPDKDMDIALMHVLEALLAAPIVLVIGFSKMEALPYLAASIVIHLAYFYLLIQAYQKGDFGLTYPLMRGVSPLLIALASILLLHESFSLIALLGIIGISAGVLALGLSRHALDSPKAVLYALCNAGVIALYSIIDGIGVRVSGNSWQYIATLFFLDGFPFALAVYFYRRGALISHARSRWPVATGGAVATFASYGATLWAMSRAPVAFISAIRETSVLFAMLIGILFFREAFTFRRLISALLIVFGIGAIRFG